MFRISFYQVLYFGFFNVHIFEIPFSVRKKTPTKQYGGLDISPELRSSFIIGH